MLVPVRKQILVTLAANEGALCASLNFVNFQMIKTLDMLYEVIILLGFSSCASKMMPIIVIAAIGEDASLRHVSSGRGEDHGVPLTDCHLSDKVFIEVLNLLGLPELWREGVLVTITDAASTETVEAPLVKLSIIGNSGSVILIDIHIYELDSVGIVCHSGENTFCLYVFTASQSTLAVVAG